LQIKRGHCDEGVVPLQEPEQFLLVKVLRLKMYGFADTVACIGDDPGTAAEIRVVPAKKIHYL